MRHLFNFLALCMLLIASPSLAHSEEEHGGQAAQADQTAGSEDSGPAAETPDGEMGGASAGHGDAAESGQQNGGVVSALKSLHPATVHFPIALLLMAALTEFFAIRRAGQGLQTATNVMIYGGGAGAVVAAVFGWIHTGIWFGGDTVMQVHRWNGTALAVIGTVLAVLAARPPAGGRTALRTLLFVAAALILVQGYLGGELAHGPNHLGM